MPQSQQRKDKKHSESASSKKSKTSEEGNETIVEPKQHDTPSKLVETQATITQLFREGQEVEKSGNKAGENNENRQRGREERKEERNIESILKSLESKMNKMVTVDYLEKEFKKLITEEFLCAKIESLKKQLKTYFDKELEKVYTRIKTLESKSIAADERVEKLESKILDLEAKLESMQNVNKKLEDKEKEHAEELCQVKYAMKTREIQMNDLEQYTRSNNIRIYGLEDRNPSETAEETTSIVLQFLKNKLEIDLNRNDIEIAHRLGRFLDNGNRPVICRFVLRLNKMKVMKSRRLLKGSVYVIKEDLTHKNAKLLQDTAEVENVKTVWADQGKIIALVDSENGERKQKVVVTLRTDLSRPLTLEKPVSYTRSVRR